ncbi:hypothetical protein DPMN_082845 [Dreissena polymorpha]|uniref:Uncharacterized protein n=1 Tax=Dreissena polymorpha TaxID=45954 RepID=A0A9D3YBI0_DREPO|nr:hypothetical protein DPMN_082845 [Dreissena polymorpha]
MFFVFYSCSSVPSLNIIFWVQSQSQLAHYLLWTSESEPACTSSVVDISVRASLHILGCGHPC